MIEIDNTKVSIHVDMTERRKYLIDWPEERRSILTPYPQISQDSFHQVHKLKTKRNKYVQDIYKIYSKEIRRVTINFRSRIENEIIFGPFS